ncbi:MAG: hypothetical protein ACXWZR_15200 [Mycobacterium sp.]
MPSERDDPAADRDAAASRFVAALGATGLLLWRAANQLTTPGRRALHD